MYQNIKHISLILCGLVIGWFAASSHYTKQLDTQYIEYLEEDMKSSDRHFKHMAKIYLSLLKASEKGSDALLRETYYGFGVLSERLDKKEKAKYQTKFIEFLTDDCKNNIYKSCTYLGEHYYKQEQYNKALPVLLKSAQQDNLKAISLLVDLYRTKSWPQANEETAKSWMMKLGENG